jgi:hypothetical protein
MVVDFLRFNSDRISARIFSHCKARGRIDIDIRNPIFDIDQVFGLCIGQVVISVKIAVSTLFL